MQLRDAFYLLIYGGLPPSLYISQRRLFAVLPMTTVASAIATEIPPYARYWHFGSLFTVRPSPRCLRCHTEAV
jgi:hypothetical protein